MQDLNASELVPACEHAHKLACNSLDHMSPHCLEGKETIV